MNIFTLVPGAGGMVLRGTDGPVLAPPVAARLLGGIRPESLRLAETGIPATVLHAEYLGADTVLACSAGDGTRLLARLPGRVALADGAPVWLAADPGALHLFDAASRRRLDPPHA